MNLLGIVGVKVKADLTPLDQGFDEAKRKSDKFDQEASKGFRKTEDAARKAGNQAKKTGKDIEAANNNAKNSTERLKRAFDGVRGSALRAARDWAKFAGGIAAGAAVFGSVRSFAQFEQGLIGVSKTTNIVGPQLQSLAQEVEEIARVVPIATTELLGIAQAAGQLGVTGNDDILAFTETVGKLGLASDLAGEQAATSLARILTVTGEALGDVDRLGSTIVQLGNNFAATESEIASASTRVAQSTAQFGIAASEVAGIGTALTAVGVQAEAGGTVIGRAFQAINDAVRQGGEEMRAFTKVTGMTANELQTLFQNDPTAAFQAFVDGLGRVNEQGGDVTAALKAVGLEGVRVVQVLGTLAGRSDVLADALGQANQGWVENNALNKEAEAAAKALTAQTQLLWNSMTEAGVAIGAAVAPAVVLGVQGLASAFQFLADNIDTVGKIVSIAGTALITAFGPAILASIASGFVTLGSVAVTAISSITAAIAANPLGALAVAFATVIVSIYQFRDELERVLGVDLAAIVTNGANLLIGSFVGAYENIKFVWTNLPDAIGAATIGAVNAVIGAVNDMISGAASQVDKFIGLLNEIPGVDISAIGNVEALQPIANDHSSRIRDAWGGEVEPGTGRISGGAGRLARAVRRDYLGELFGEAETSSRTAENAVKDFNSALGAANDNLDDIGGSGESGGGGSAGSAAKAIKEVATEAQKAAKEALNFGASVVKGFVSDLRGGLQEGKSLWNSFASAASNALDKVIDKLLNNFIDAIFQANTAASGLGGGGLLGGLFSWLGFANGGVIDQGNVVPFARGGVVNRPTVFPMANGAGLMGEAGPEAIMPLRRGPDGRLGVSSTPANSNQPQRVRVDVFVTSNDDKLRVFVREEADGQIKEAAPRIVGSAVNRANANVLPEIARYQKQQAGGDYR